MQTHQKGNSLMRGLAAIAFFLQAYQCIGKHGEVVWYPGTEGLFSQFLQLRVMNHVRRELGFRDLNVISFYTNHLDRTSISLCDVFRLPTSIRCSPAVPRNNTVCGHHSNVIRYAYNAQNYHSRQQIMRNHIYLGESVCFHGALPFIGGGTRRDALLRANSFSEPKFEFHKKYRTAFQEFRRNLFLHAGINASAGVDGAVNYTVVHWRRGDQLATRCKQEKDSSVNCRTPEELAELVRRHSNESLVYVATNERNVDILARLQGAGLTTFSQVDGGDADSLESFIVEVRLMLEASVFLGWGVSIINDIVEHERLLRYKSWCSAGAGDGGLSLQETYPTWCWLSRQLPTSSNVTTEEARRALFLHDANMTISTLQMSRYNISYMPPFLSEVAGNQLSIQS
ncbi:hypothetical protein B484DRAFT_429721 [Ochromonadaceae sp. CCMP2298]|nr:hypothetical protein B484DRAFT_429721 [Ochromonadaceae sp. CCMP2298]